MCVEGLLCRWDINVNRENNPRCVRENIALRNKQHEVDETVTEG